MEKKKIKDKKLPVGFTFSFPCRQSKIDEVRHAGNKGLHRSPRGEKLMKPFSGLLFSFAYGMACMSLIYIYIYIYIYIRNICFFVLCFAFCFLGLRPWHMEVHRLGVELEL